MSRFIELTDQYHKIIIIVYAFYALVIAQRAASRNVLATWSLPGGFVVVSLLTLALLRLPTTFVNFPYNQDEAQFAAAAIKFHSNLNTWQSSDMGTSGPLNAFPLMWPFLFNLDTG